MPHLSLISGSTRAQSSNTCALRTIAALAPDGLTTSLFDGLADLPAFTPDADPERPHPAVAALRADLAAADLVVFSTPEYAGTLPGSLKNLLDWTVGTADLYEKPVAWTNVAAPGRGGGADETMELVLGYVSAEIVDRPRVPVAREAIDADGIVTDEPFRDEMRAFLDRIATRLSR